jgi:Putative mono-oxygenase ydhR
MARPPGCEIVRDVAWKTYAPCPELQMPKSQLASGWVLPPATQGDTTMITALVQFDLPSPITLAEATGRFESSAPKYRNLPGLARKYYVVAEDGRRAGGIYLWESRAAAEAVYNGEWRERVSKLYGSAPSITWFETPVIVDNTAGGTVATAA